MGGSRLSKPMQHASSNDMPASLRDMLQQMDRYFAEGNLRLAKVLAESACHRFPSFPEAKSASIAMRVHLEAAAKREPVRHSVFIAPGSEFFDRDDARAKREKHNKLCDHLNPANTYNSSAAAAAAYNLLVNQ